MLFQVGVTAIFTIIAASRNPKYLSKLIPAIFGFAAALVILANTETFQTASEAFTSRFEAASDTEGGLKGTLGDRFLGGMVSAISSSGEQPFFGHGLGMGTNVGSMLLSNGNNFLIAEEEWGRLVGELGLLFGITVILLRLGLVIKVLIASFQQVATGNLLPWLLLSFGFLSILQGQWAQPTALGFSESMLRFAQMIDSEIKKIGLPTEVWWPKAFFGSLSKSTNHGLGKWLGYIDKWFIFPIVLRYRLITKGKDYSNARFLICDHSNAPYLNHLPSDRTAITCHDVIAIRGALGYKDAYVPASAFGKILQKQILHSLSRAKLLASVSNFTARQLLELSASNKLDKAKWVVIHNALNADFRPLKNTQSTNLLIQAGVDINIPFILHVGSSLQRKNRKLLLSMVESL
nr:hypothetical protein [Tanacetum cinerariifolium]